MKKFLLSFAAIAAFSTASFAQLSIGVKGGVNVSYLTETEDYIEKEMFGEEGASLFDEEERGSLGAQFSLFGEYALSESFVLGLGVQYETTGERVVYEVGSSASLEFSVTNSFVKIPVYGKYELSVGAFKPYVAVGPYVAFWNTTEAELKIESEEGNQVAKIDEFDELENEFGEVNKVDFGATLGLGTSVAAGPGAVLVGVNYDLGFSELIDSDDFAPKNQSLQFNLGYLIPLGGSSAE